LLSYALVLNRRDNPAAARAALNYVLLGAVATGTLLYGLSILYGLTGTLHFASEAFWQHLSQAPTATTVLALGLVLAGLLFKLGAAPLHFWAPDAYQSAPLPVALLLSTAPKIAVAVALWRLHIAATTLLPGPAADAVRLLFIGAAVLSLVVGTFGALTEPDVRRLLAYSSIAQAGFLLLAISGAALAGPASVLLYAAFLLLANGAVFLGVAVFERLAQAQSPGVAQLRSHSVAYYAGLGRRYPLPAAAVTVGFIALTGLPPTVGFSAKLLAFVTLWQAEASLGGRVLLGTGVLATAISLFFYLRVPYWLFLKEAAVAPDPTAPHRSPRGPVWLAVGLAALTVVAFVRADWVVEILSR
jgi:NADH-quinone oxidoreductase subunit N